MRTIIFDRDAYRGEIRTSDLICPAFGNNYLDIAFVQESQAIPDKVTIVLNLGGVRITKPLYFSQLADDQLDGVFFNLEWFKYYAPKSGTRTLQLFIYDNNTRIASVEYQLTAGRGEVELPVRTFEINGITYKEGDYFRVCPTERTKHWSNVEFLATQDTDNYLLVYVGNGHAETEFYDNGIAEVTHQPLGEDLRDLFNLILVDYNKGTDGVVFSMPIKENYCADIELRITNRYGLRGAIGGKIIDSSEGGDDVKINFKKVTPYNGIHRHEKIGQKIQKEVFFDCEGDADLLGLLRDACVYGIVEWYDERTEQWLPCEVTDNSLDTDPYKEQSITLILQQL